MVWQDLEQIFEIQLSEVDYDFDLLALGRASDGTLWRGADAGCSCPCPWDGVEFTPLRCREDWMAFEEAATSTEAKDAVAKAKAEWKKTNALP